MSGVETQAVGLARRGIADALAALKSGDVAGAKVELARVDSLLEALEDSGRNVNEGAPIPQTGHGEI